MPELAALFQAEAIDSPLSETATLGAPASIQWAVADSGQVLAVRSELVIVDAATPDYQQLLDDLTGDTSAGRQFEVLVIDSTINGIDALSQILAQHQDLDALHIISHGAPGSVQLGNTALSADNLADYSEAVSGWGDALSDGADLLFYGCDLAGNAVGEQFVDNVAELTGADVAASSDVTGNAEHGGNWTFEYVSGSVETEVAFSPVVQAGWGGTLALEDFPAGSYVIDMGQATQTIANSIRPYGLIYDLTMNNNVPVSWAIDPTKDYNFQTQGQNTPSEPVDTVGDTIDFTAITTTGSKDYEGGSFIINEAFIDASVLSVINTWRSQGVVVDEITADFSAEIYDEITYFPKTVFNDQNAGLVEDYFANAGFYTTAGAPAPKEVTVSFVNGQPVYSPPLSAWKDDPTVISGPLALNACYDVFLIPHAEPSSNWTTAEQQRFLDFVTEDAGGVWAADHTVSEIEGAIDIDNDGNSDTLFLTNGLVHYNDHANDPTPPYRYVNGQSGTYNTAGDPVMQIMGRYDSAITNGSEHTYVPDGAPVRPTTTVSLIDPDHSLDPTPGSDTDPRNEVFLTAYGPAFGDTDNGNIMYMAGHSLAKSSGAANVAGQRTFFNFLLTEGARRQPVIDAVLPPGVSAGDSATFTATISGGSGVFMYEWVSSDGGTFSNPSGTWNVGDPPLTTQFQMNSPEDTVSLIVSDSCGRQTIFFETLSDPPPTVDLDGDDTTTGPGETGYNGTWAAGGAITNVTDPDVVVTDNSGIILSAVIDLTNRLDGASETLIINQTLAGSG